MNDVAEFGDDAGTIHHAGGTTALTTLWPDRGWRRRLRSLVHGRALVWFVDDERRNREWFARWHGDHFAVVTFSCLSHCKDALDRGTPCDVVVTDIFFPARQVDSNDEAGALMAIYDKIKGRRVSELPGLWAEERSRWHLDGFDVARIVADAAARRKERIPVLLFSRKATLLLDTDDWLDEPPAAVENTFWLLEKVDPSIEQEAARKAASIQRGRITSALRYRRALAPWWRRIIGR
jgi:CheY-like chemotaxis protein